MTTIQTNFACMTQDILFGNATDPQDWKWEFMQVDDIYLDPEWLF